MIQRIQTIFLLLACIAFAVSAVMGDTLWAAILLGCLALLSLGNVFLYRKRTTQATLCTAMIAITIVYYIVLAVQQPVLVWPMALPMVSVLFLFLARNKIVKDEKLVRSLNRIR
jgi:4-hydroxybenzoate polyprenyltransferase